MSHASAFIPPHGGYRKLLSYQKAEIIYDGTKHFTNRFYSRGDRTIDQMVQAARSGKQNIAEGSMASATSKETELKLINVAKASHEELLIDFQDFLRLRHLLEWPKEHEDSQRLRELHRIKDPTYATYKHGIEHQDPAVSANVLIGLIKVTTYLLSKQIQFLEQDFLQNGGLRERMYNARVAARTKR